MSIADQAGADSALIAMPKVFHGEVTAEDKVTNQAFKVMAFRPLDEDGVTIPKATIEIHVRTGLTADRCKYTFTLFRLDRQKKHRVYQLEVVPRDKRSHNGPPRLYGPHEHFGDGPCSVVTAIKNELCCSDYNEWLRLFCSRINLDSDATFPPPFGDDLWTAAG